VRKWIRQLGSVGLQLLCHYQYYVENMCWIVYISTLRAVLQESKMTALTWTAPSLCVLDFSPHSLSDLSRWVMLVRRVDDASILSISSPCLLLCPSSSRLTRRKKERKIQNNQDKYKHNIGWCYIAFITYFGYFFGHPLYLLARGSKQREHRPQPPSRLSSGSWHNLFRRRRQRRHPILPRRTWNG
jgi:hypothetical protein